MSFQASLSGQSSFTAAYLYYDLSERLISFGKLSEVNLLNLLYVCYKYFTKLPQCFCCELLPVIVACT